MNPFKFAIIGCGRVSKNHVGPLNEVEGAKLVAVCDLVPGRMEPYRTAHGIRTYTNYHQMLQTEDVDVVSIMTPSGMHPQHAIDVMSIYRKHVVVEKPLALSADAIFAMRTAAESAGVTIFPVYQNRYNKAVQRVRTGLNNGELGRPALGTIRVRWCRPQRYYARDPWRGTWAMDGGAATNQGIHYIDLLQYLLGDVAEVNAQIATLLVQVEVEDTAIATVKFTSGAMGVVEITTAARPDDFEASISVLAENGTAILSGIACNELVTYTPAPDACAAASEQFPDAYGYGHWPFYRDIIAHLSGQKRHPVSFEEGCRAIRLLNAIYRSAEDRAPVNPAAGLASRRLGQRDPRLEALYLTKR